MRTIPDVDPKLTVASVRSQESNLPNINTGIVIFFAIRNAIAG
jgi:hypothetical protein